MTEKQLGLHLISYQVIFVVLPDHQHNSLGVGQLGVVHHVEALGGVLLVRLVVDQTGEVSLLPEELNHKELVALISGKGEQEGVEFFKPLLRVIFRYQERVGSCGAQLSSYLHHFESLCRDHRRHSVLQQFTQLLNLS